MFTNMLCIYFKEALRCQITHRGIRQSRTESNADNIKKSVGRQDTINK